MKIKSSSLLVLFLHYYYFFQTCHAKCTPSSCGIIGNISPPFRLKGDGKYCGHRRFQLACENNVASINLDSQKYYVKAINYSNGFNYFFNTTIRVVDASLTNDLCSFPTFSAYAYNFTIHNHHRHPYLPSSNFRHVYFMRCPQPLKNSSLFTDVTECGSMSDAGYAYIKVGRTKISELPDMRCELKVIVMTSWEFRDLNNVSLSELHDSLMYGFELSTFCSNCSSGGLVPGLLLIIVAIVGLSCALLSPPLMTILGFVAIFGLLGHALRYLYIHITYNLEDSVELKTALVSTIVICAPRFAIFPLAMWVIIYKFRKRHLSMFEGIESFLQSHNELTSIRYSYSDIKKMTRNFRDKLGEGGYGSVYMGKLRSGHDAAVKLLRKCGANDQDFMNEIATIGRIHHVNVVKLVGYCAQGSKRALVYDFMPNGSLEKYLFVREKMSSLTWDMKFKIAIGIARGIEYLHQGCNFQILHFDIKPHNILLDDKFIPKISDFGLAKFCAVDKKSVTMTTARGTIGYVAPELINRSIGAVSYKVDVYSFGMLLIEMVGLKRDLKENNGDSSRYFPYWIYDFYKEGKDIEIAKIIDNHSENESGNTVAKKMTIVALWCIQMNPSDRPPINQVLQMLEGNVEHLHIPDYPLESNQIAVDADKSEITCSSNSISFLRHDDASPSVEISVQE